MQELIGHCRSSGTKFSESLLDIEGLDHEMIMYFYDIAMPSMSTYMYKSRILFHKFSEVVSAPEEAFALLVFENNFERWIYQAEEQKKEQMNIHPESDSEEIPDALYQLKVKKRSDGVNTVGKWTDEGLERFNEILSLVLEVRKTRTDFEEALNDKYVSRESKEEYQEKLRKHNRSQDVDSVSRQTKRVKVINLFNETDL